MDIKTWQEPPASVQEDALVDIVSVDTQARLELMNEAMEQARQENIVWGEPSHGKTRAMQQTDFCDYIYEVWSPSSSWS